MFHLSSINFTQNSILFFHSFIPWALINTKNIGQEKKRNIKIVHRLKFEREWKRGHLQKHQKNSFKVKLNEQIYQKQKKNTKVIIPSGGLFYSTPTFSLHFANKLSFFFHPWKKKKNKNCIHCLCSSYSSIFYTLRPCNTQLIHFIHLFIYNVIKNNWYYYENCYFKLKWNETKNK